MLERSVGERQIDPCPILRRVQKFLSASIICAEGSWEVGLAILRVCRRTMEVHPILEILQSLGDVLSIISASYTDVDVRDQG